MSDVVYYLRRNGLIKIGWTGNIKARMRALRPDELLAAEPGCMHIETGRHHQFGEHRLPNTGDGDEWFQPAPELLDHIEQMASLYPKPALPQMAPPRLDAPQGPEEESIIQTMQVGRFGRKLVGEGAAELHRRGWTWPKIAAEFGVDQSTAHRWLRWRCRCACGWSQRQSLGRRLAKLNYHRHLEDMGVTS